MSHALELVVASAFLAAALAAFGYFGRRILQRADDAAAERWRRIYDELTDVTGDMREGRRELRDTVADLARVQGNHERWARETLVIVTDRISRIEGRLRVVDDERAG